MRSTCGAVLQTVGCSLLILGLLEGGTAWAWVSGTSYGVLGTGAVEAGLTLGALTIGWPIAASQAGRLYLRIGFRDTALIGAVLAVGGSVLTVSLSEGAELWQVAGAMFVTGLGMGLSSSPLVVAVGSVVGWDRRGVRTGTSMFCPAIGSAVGAAMFGAIVNTSLARRFDDAPAALRGQLPADVDGTAAALTTPGPVADSPARACTPGRTASSSRSRSRPVSIVVAVALVPRRTEPLVCDD